MKATSLGDSRVDLVLPSGNRSEIRNHSALPLPGSLPSGLPSSVTSAPQPAGAWSGPDGTLHPIAGHNLLTDSSWFLPALTLARLVAGSNYVLSYSGQENRDGQPVLHISATHQSEQTATGSSSTGVSATLQAQAMLLQQLGEMDVYLDPGTLLPVALAFSAHPDNNALIDIPAEIRFSDYHSSSGTQAPFHVQKYLNNGLVLDLQFTDAVLNSGLSAASFQIQ